MAQSTKTIGVINLADTISGMLDTLGKSFLLVGYFPALLFVLAHQLILFPVWLGHPLNIFTTAAQFSTFTEQLINFDEQLWAILSTNLTTFFLPVFVGLLLLSLNSGIIRLYEGRAKFLQKTLLHSSYQHNIKKCRELYGEVVELKRKYREVLAELGETDDSTGNLDLCNRAIRPK